MAPGFKPLTESFFVQINYMKIEDIHKLCEGKNYEKGRV